MNEYFELSSRFFDTNGLLHSPHYHPSLFTDETSHVFTFLLNPPPLHFGRAGFYRRVIDDTALTAYEKYVVNWSSFNPAHLSSTQHTTTRVRSAVGFCAAKTLQMSIPPFGGKYDALNRIRKALYPEARNGERREPVPAYNKVGAVQALQWAGEPCLYARPDRFKKVPVRSA